MSVSAPAVNPARLKALFCDMVDIYSPSGKEHELTGFLDDWLREAGVPVTRQPVSDERENLAIEPPGAMSDTLFLGHVDTVPAFDIERVESDERDGAIHGLGTADMKGGCAAMIEAFTAFVESGGRLSRAALHLVVGEEESGDGTAALLEQRAFDWAVVGEPTGLIPCFRHYSYCEMLVRAYGTRRHAAMGTHEQNAIMGMLAMLRSLVEYVESSGEGMILNIRDLNSGEAGFAVPDRCSAWVDLHIPPAAELTRLTGTLEQLVRDSLSDSAVTHYETGFPTLAQGYALAEDGWLPEALRRAFATLALDWAPGAFRSHSDANLLWEAGCKPVILGPGQLARAHTRDESITFDEVLRAAQLYLALLESLHGK